MQNTFSFKTIIAAAVITTVTLPVSVMAKGPVIIPGHPQISAVDTGINNEQSRIAAGVKAGQINAQQATADESRLVQVQQQMTAEEAKNGGTLSKTQYTALNNELTTNSKDIYGQRHDAAPAGSSKVAATPSNTDIVGHPKITEVDNTVAAQQNNIDTGVKAGQLTAQEVVNDESHLLRTGQNLSIDEAHNHGTLTNAEQQSMDNKLLYSSTTIVAQRLHDVIAPIRGHPQITEVDQREVNQKTRIADALKAGDLNAQEAKTDEQRLSQIQKQLTADEKGDHGKITLGEFDTLNTELTKNSQAIDNQTGGKF